MNKQQFIDLFNYVQEQVDGLLETELVVGDSFSYNMLDDIITITLDKTDKDMLWESFMLNYVKEVFGYNMTLEEMDMFSLLHEIGHNQTLYTFEIEEIVKYINDMDAVSEDDLYGYRQLKAEYVADKWAIDYMIQHKEQLNNILK